MLRWPIREGVELRLPEDRHSLELFQLIEDNRARLEQWMDWAHTTRSLEDTLAFIQKARSDFRRPDAYHLLIFCEDRISGVCSFILINDNVGEIGYWISEAQQGKGIITDICREFVRFGFGHAGLTRIQIRCAVGNTRSSAVPRRLQFVCEGVLRQALRCGDRLFDAEMFSLLKSDYEPK